LVLGVNIGFMLLTGHHRFAVNVVAGLIIIGVGVAGPA
jgi:hypothetical protein